MNRLVRLILVLVGVTIFGALAMTFTLSLYTIPVVP